MRLNKFIARHTGLSRRAADAAIAANRVSIDGQPAELGSVLDTDDQKVTLDGRAITPAVNTITIMLNKPIGYVCSRNGQGSATIYDLLPEEYHRLKPVGRLDKDSSGLLLLTNDGDLANQLTHPSQKKEKIYQVTLDKSLTKNDANAIEVGVRLDDGLSKLQLKPQGDPKHWQVTMHEGRNRQIRRTFAALGYEVAVLHRTQFGYSTLSQLASGDWRTIQGNLQGV